MKILSERFPPFIIIEDFYLQTFFHSLVNAGGGFAYVGAMQDSFPHALELSKKGYNASAFAKSEDKGNLAFLEKERYTHDYPTLCEYTYNGLCFFWNKAK